ncbi:MAG TPA: hypothetical protein VGF28_05265 [Thermoanaerobaculia bacterium]
MTKVWLFLLGLLTQFVTCADRHLDRARWSFAPVPVARATDVRDAGMVADQQIVVVDGKWEQWEPRTVVRFDADGKANSLRLPARDTAGCYGEALHTDGEAWRYSGCSGNGVQFAGSDRGPVYVPDDSTAHAHEWMPFDDAEGGVLLSVERDGRTCVAKLVTPAGIEKTLGTFYRGSDTWTTEPGESLLLDEEKIAMITLEPERDQWALVLRVFDQGEITTSRIAVASGSWSSIEAAAGADGELVVVGVPYDTGGVVAFLIDPMQPDKPTVRHLSGATSTVASHTVCVIATGRGYAAAWIDNRTVHLAEFDTRRVLPAVRVGDGAGGQHFPLLSLVHTPGDEPRDVAVLWTSDDGNVMMRRLPQPVTGALVAGELLARLSERLDRLTGPPR